METADNKDKDIAASTDLTAQTLYHGTKADLKPGDMVAPALASNYAADEQEAYAYLTAIIETATWEAELTPGDAPARIYIVTPTGPIEDDPYHTDKKFPGNPTTSYRTRHPLTVVEEVTGWQPHPPHKIESLRTYIDQRNNGTAESIDDWR